MFPCENNKPPFTYHGDCLVYILIPHKSTQDAHHRAAGCSGLSLTAKCLNAQQGLRIPDLKHLKKKKTLVPKVPIIQHSQVFCQGLSACFKKKKKKAPVFQIETVLPQGTVASVIPAGPSRSPPHFLTPHKPPPAPGGAEPDGVQLFHRSTCDSLHGANPTRKCTASFQATIMRTSTIGCNSCFSNCIFNLKFPRT